MRERRHQLSRALKMNQGHQPGMHAASTRWKSLENRFSPGASKKERSPAALLMVAQ